MSVALPPGLTFWLPPALTVVLMATAGGKWYCGLDTTFWVPPLNTVASTPNAPLAIN